MPLHFEYEDVPTKKLTGFTCDKCQTLHEDTLEIQEKFHYKDIGGYNSIWGDMSRIEITLCQTCFYGLMKPYSVV